MSENRYIVTQEIKSEAQYKKGFYSKDIMFVVVFMMVSYFLKPLVATKFQYPFLIGSLLIAVFLRTPAIYNKKRKTLDSLVIYMRRENTVYHPIFRQNKISASDQDKRGKVASTILYLIDLRNYNEQHRCFQRKDGSYIDFFKIKTRDRGNTAENEIQYDILKFLKLLQTYVQQLFASYDDCEIVDETLGHIRYKNIDLFDKQEKISDILQLGYNFYVYDYGVFTSPDFNKTSFLEKELKIFVVGCKPNELHFTQNVLRSLFYQDVCYIFNFTPEADKKELLEIMEEKAERTFFADWTVDPFTYSNSEIYSKILPLEVLRQEEPVKKSFFPFFNKKRGI